jgi:hypothetical protein
MKLKNKLELACYAMSFILLLLISAVIESGY